jgi:hypothetical protein
MNGNISENKDMLAIIYLDVCNLTVGNLKIGQKGLIWIVRHGLKNKNTVSNNWETKLQSRIG